MHQMMRSNVCLLFKLFLLSPVFVVLAKSVDFAQGVSLTSGLLKGVSDKAGDFKNSLSKFFDASATVFDLTADSMSITNLTINGIDSSILEDLFNLLHDTNTTCQIARNDGYNCEEHETVTKDGYIITMHRIPPCGSCLDESRARAPVVLAHGLLGSSADWTLLGKGRALAYMLAEACLDVWMMDMRGSTNSMKHVHLDNSDPKYWNWTHHEIGTYDVPAVIDHVLAETRHGQVVYVGYSLGSTVMLVTCSMLPQYNDKIKAFVALAPVAFLEHTKSLVGALAYVTPELADLSNSLGEYAFLRRGFALDKSLKLICATGALTGACDVLLFKIMGHDPQQLTQDMTKKYLSHNPAGTSTKTMRHLAESVTKGTFAQYNYGESENLKLYNSTCPPDYPLEKITTQTFFIYGPNDILSDPKDVFKLYDKLSTTKHLIEVDYSQFTHMDFTTAKDARVLLYDKLLPILSIEDEECCKRAN